MTDHQISTILKRLNDIETQHTAIHADLSKQMTVCNKQNEDLKKQIEPLLELLDYTQKSATAAKLFSAFLLGTGALILMFKSLIQWK